MATSSKSFYRRAQQELCTLIDDGYTIVVHYYDRVARKGFASLRHKANHNRITFVVRPTGYTMYLNGKICKTEGL